MPNSRVSLRSTHPRRVSCSGSVGPGFRRDAGSSCGEDLAGAPGIGGDLSLERIEAGEFLFRPDEVDERHAQMPAVKVGIGVKEMRFEARLGSADRRAQTDIGDAVDRAPAEQVIGAVARDTDSINPQGGAQILAEAEIGSRKADRAAAPIAEHDAPVALPTAAELV